MRNPYRSTRLRQWARRMGVHLRLAQTASEYGQDRWVLREASPQRHGGYFVDIGAADGITYSNTFMLEKKRGWTGICIEADPQVYARLQKNRACITVNTCLDRGVGYVDFLSLNYVSGIVDSDTDNSPESQAARIETARQSSHLLRMPTRPLVDVLREHGAPATIDYLSIDIEGAETRVLGNFPFDAYTFLAMTIERPSEALQQLLLDTGYGFVKQERVDSYYVHRSHPRYEVLVGQPAPVPA